MCGVLYNYEVTHTLTTFFLQKKPTLLCAEEVKTNTTFLGIANLGTFLSVRWYKVLAFFTLHKTFDSLREQLIPSLFGNPLLLLLLRSNI